jgi:hypothetical protein
VSDDERSPAVLGGERRQPRAGCRGAARKLGTHATLFMPREGTARDRSRRCASTAATCAWWTHARGCIRRRTIPFAHFFQDQLPSNSPLLSLFPFLFSFYIPYSFHTHYYIHSSFINLYFLSSSLLLYSY